MDDVQRAGTAARCVTVTRVGTRVVVRLAGWVGDDCRAELARALADVEQLAVRDVLVDLDEVVAVDGAGLDFLVELGARWQAAVRNAPADVRRQLARAPA